MDRPGARAALIAVAFSFAAAAAVEPPVISPCDQPPAAVEALGAGSVIESFGLAPAAKVAAVAIPSPSERSRSVLRIARGGAPPRDVKLAGSVLGLALTPDGKTAFAIVRVAERKGGTRSVDLVVVNLETARAGSGISLPVTARGLAISESGSTLLVASRNELRTFQLPSLTSGPLYRVLGDNVGVAPLSGSSYVLLAQPTRVALADLAGTQTRDGLVLEQEVAAPAQLSGMLASAGQAGPIARAEDGASWCVRAEPPPPPSPIAKDAPVEAPIAAPVAVAATQAEAPAVDPPPVVPPVPEPPAPERPAPEPPAAETARVDASPQKAEPGVLIGVVAGPAVAELAAIVVLGPDNVLHEAARIVPDERGGFRTGALPPGSYRIVAAGIGGRVLICDPPFITVRVDSNGAVEAPVLKVMSAQ